MSRRPPAQASGPSMVAATIRPCWALTAWAMRLMVWGLLTFARGLSGWWSMFRGRPGEDPLAVVRRRKWLVLISVTVWPVLAVLGPWRWTLRTIGPIPVLACAVLVLISIIRIRRLGRITAAPAQAQQAAPQPVVADYDDNGKTLALEQMAGGLLWHLGAGGVTPAQVVAAADAMAVTDRLWLRAVLERNLAALSELERKGTRLTDGQADAALWLFEVSLGLRSQAPMTAEPRL